MIAKKSATAYLIGLIRWCSRRLRASTAKEYSLKILAMQCYSRKVWRATVDEIDRNQLVPQYPHWRQFLVMWQGLGNFIPCTSDAAIPAAFEMLQRCSWHKCMCSVHKPAHRLKLCKGCRVVAYCNTGCQTRSACRVAHDYIKN